MDEGEFRSRSYRNLYGAVRFLIRLVVAIIYRGTPSSARSDTAEIAINGACYS